MLKGQLPLPNGAEVGRRTAVARVKGPKLEVLKNRCGGDHALAESHPAALRVYKGGGLRGATFNALALSYVKLLDGGHKVIVF